MYNKYNVYNLVMYNIKPLINIFKNYYANEATKSLK